MEWYDLVERTDYAEILAARVLKPVTVIDVPVAAAVSTPITGSIQVKDASSGTALPVNKTYYVPLLNKITNAMDQMIAVTLVNGAGELSFQVENPGVYGIRTILSIYPLRRLCKKRSFGGFFISRNSTCLTCKVTPV